jgi:dTDP-4-dehydrorhamnose reductase
MPRALILGGTGMLGHALWAECSGRLDAFATIRGDELDARAAAAGLDPERTLIGVRAEKPESVERALDATGAEVAVNCIGVVKQRVAESGPVATVQANALFPHQLAAACEARGVRLIHLSTDCVYSGRRGAYGEDDQPDPVDLYGRSKLAGEPQTPGSVTVRTSMLGREVATRHGLLEWLLAQRERVPGYTRAIFSGPTTPVLARALTDVIELWPDLEGTWHIGAEPISKHDLLVLLRDAFELELEIEPDDGVAVDRSLDPSRFRAATGWTAPDWEAMAAELAAQDALSERRPVAGR